MPYIHIENFSGGLDSRRLPECSVPGTLQTLTNAHINRGGDIEKRKAFVKQDELSSDTHGLLSIQGLKYVFGSVASVSVPRGYLYRQLQHPESFEMARVLDTAIYGDKPYVIAEYEDGSLYHFYDATRVTQWEDGRARGSFFVSGGSESAGTQSSFSFDITDGSEPVPPDPDEGDPGQDANIGSLTVDGVELLANPVDYRNSNESTALDLSAAINANSTTPNYQASASGNTVTVVSVDVGTQGNGLDWSATVNGTITLSDTSGTLSGGTDPNAVTSVQVDGVELLDFSVPWEESNTITAAEVAAAINDGNTSPDYIATSHGGRVNILVPEEGTAGNGRVVSASGSGDVVVDTVTNLEKGDTGTDALYTPGVFVRTVESKMYAVAGTVEYFSAVNDPTIWIFDPGDNNTTGAGFRNLGNFASDSDRLIAMETYFGQLAIFSRRNIQVWTANADESLDTQQQVLRNTGAIAPQAVIAFGSSDIFYLSDTGIRSIRARDSSNAANVSDVGTPIDERLQAYIDTVSAFDVQRAVGEIEPVDGRYWLAIGNRIMVFSYFPGSDITAWSEYTVPFVPTDFSIVGKQMFVRGDDNAVYLYGGITGNEFDNPGVTVTLPFLDAQRPASPKQWQESVMAAEGLWKVERAEDLRKRTQYQTIHETSDTTYSIVNLPMDGYSTHISLRITNNTSGYARIGSLAIRYSKGASD